MEDFNEFRSKGIGGSDLAGILGLSMKEDGKAWKTPMDVFYEKTKGLQSKETAIQTRGKQLERYLFDWYKNNHHYIQYVSSVPIIDKNYECIRGNLDGFFITPENLKVLEIKTSNSLVKRHFGDSEKEGNTAIPDPYLAQIAYYCSINSAEIKENKIKKGDLLVAFSFDDIQIYPYERDLKLEKFLRETAINFWNDHVLKDIPPAVKTMEDVHRYVKSITGKKTTASPIIFDLCIKKSELKAQRSSAEKDLKAVDSAIKIFMGNSEFLLSEDEKVIATFKTHQRNYFDQDLFKKENPELYEKYCSKKEQRSLLIKEGGLQ